MTRARRIGQVAHQLLGATAAAVVFTATFAGSIVLHGDLPATRRFVARSAGWLLDPLFAGKITLHRIDHLGFDGVDIQSAEVLDPWGQRALLLQGVHVRLDLLQTARRLLKSPGSVFLTLDDVRVDDVEAGLDQTPGGQSRLQAAFSPKPKPPAPPAPPAPPRPLRVELPRVTLGRLWAHGEPTPGLPVQFEGFRMPATALITHEGVALDVSQFGLKTQLVAPLNPTGTADYHLRLAPGQEPRMWANFQGMLGEATVGVSFQLKGKELTATVDAPRITPREFKTLAPRAQIFDELSVHAEVAGVLPRLHASARVVAGPGEVTLDADADLGKVMSFDGRWSVRDLDPRVFSQAVPPISLGGDGRVKAVLDAPRFHVDLEASTFPFSVRGQVIPGASVKARFEAGKVSGEAQIHEPGVDTQVSFQVEPSGVTQLEIDAKTASLQTMPRLRGLVDGRLQAKVKAKIDPAAGLDATWNASFAGLGKGPAHVGAGKSEGRLYGPFDQLQIDASAGGSGLQLGEARVAHATVQARGSVKGPSVRLSLSDPRWSKLVATGNLRVGPRPGLGQVKVAFEGQNVKATLDATDIDVGPGGVAVRGLQLGGDAVQARGGASLDKQGLSLDLQGKADLAKLARLAPAARGLTSGQIDFSLKLDGAKHAGYATASLKNARYESSPASVEADTKITIEGEKITADASASLLGTQGAPLARASFRGEGALPGQITNPRAWAAVTGVAQLRSLEIDLESISKEPTVQLARLVVPRLPELDGTVNVTATVRRERAEDPLAGSLEVNTKDLLVEIPPDKNDKAGRPTRFEGLDVHAMVLLLPDKRSGATGVSTSVALVGSGGPLGSFEGGLSIQPAEIRQAIDEATNPKNPGNTGALARLKATPIRGDIKWTRRALTELPESIRPKGVHGSVEAHIKLGGTLDQPTLDTSVQLWDVWAAAPGGESWPVNGEVKGKYGAEGLKLGVALRHGNKNPEGDETARVELTSSKPLGDLVWGRGAPWSLDARATLDRWHLESVPLLAERGVKGQLSGTIEALRLHEQPNIQINLALNEGKIFDATVAPATLKGFVVENGGSVMLAIDQPAPRPGQPGGQLRLTALPILTFQNGLIPRPNRTQAQTVSLMLSRFELEPFSPLAAPALADLRGVIDGEMTLAIPRETPDAPRAVRLWGNLRWNDGVLLIPQLGQTFTNGQFNLTTTTLDAVTRLEIRNASLKGTTGRISGAASFDIPHGYVLAQFMGDSADPRQQAILGHLAARIAPDEKIPVTFEGVALGDAHGLAEGRMSVDADGIKLSMAVPELTFDLPDSAGRQNLQDLSESPDIGLVDEAHSHAISRGKATPRKISVVVGLGTKLDELEGIQRGNPFTPSGSILVRRAGLEVRLAGVTGYTLQGELKTVGTVETLSGRIVALGKPFEIQRGFVRFDGQANNPFLNVGASWDAPDGSRVVAELQGYLHDAKLRLRSEPARPENEVLALVLFGRDPTAQTNPGETNNGNLAVTTGVASTLVNSLVDPVVFGRRLETRVESTSSRGTSVGVAAEIRPRLWAQVDVSTTRQQDRQNSDLSAVTLDWRFRSNWSLRTTVGDRGSSLMELLWQYRY